MKTAIGEVIDERRVDGLYSRLFDTYEDVKRTSKMEIFGNLDFEVVKNIDGKRQRIAKLKGNKILVHVRAVQLPKTALRYVIAHELAHSITKGHTRKFWKIVETIYPKFETGQNLLMKHGHELLP